MTAVLSGDISFLVEFNTKRYKVLNGTEHFKEVI